ncbi:MAG: hypothetical protein QOG92_1730 [Verrucomicrobiota bacterium]|nr:hypothetical protein [Verrucomicrobiota bacterium]
MGRATHRDFSRFLFRNRRVPTRRFWTALWLITLAILTAGKPLICGGTYLWNRFCGFNENDVSGAYSPDGFRGGLAPEIRGSRIEKLAENVWVSCHCLFPRAGRRRAYRSALCCRVLCLEWCAETDVLVTGVGKPLDSFCFCGGEDTKRNFKHAKRQSSSETTRVVQATIGHLSYTIRNGRKFTSSRRNLAI